MNSAPPGTSVLRKLQWAGWIILLLVAGLAVGRATLYDDEVPFVTQRSESEWITTPIRPTADLIAVLPASPPTFTFARRFSSTETPQTARLQGRALRTLELEINGKVVPLHLESGQNWKGGFDIDVADWLRPGRNEIRATVRNVHGPPLLEMSLDLPNQSRISTDTDWQVTGPNGAPLPAILARDSQIHPESRLLEPSWRVARKQAPLLVVLFFLCTGLAWFLIKTSRPDGFRKAPTLILIAISGLWIFLYFKKAIWMPLALGFDAHAHLTYIDFMVKHGTPPTADYGFSTYHPPVFHGLTAILSKFTGVGPADHAAAAVYRLIPMLGGWATVWLTGRLARRIWPDESLRPAIAIGTAGLLPMNLYMSTYVSNESLHATWISASLVLATEIIWASGQAWRKTLLLGVTLGLGLLTKFTSLALAPIIGGFATIRLYLVERKPIGQTAAVGTSLLFVASVIAGWFYIRNWMLFGDPVVWNLDVPGKPTWWMLPGFRSSASYLQFGEALSYPFFSGFVSFWDGIYSTLWADGLVAGMIRVSTRHLFWRYDFMTLIPVFAVPATLCMGWGFLSLIADSFRSQEPRRILTLSMITSVLFVLAFSLLFITIRLPFYAQAKAPYILAGTLPLALCAAQGLSAFPRKMSPQTATPWLSLYWGWVGTLAGIIVIAFAA